MTEDPEQVALADLRRHQEEAGMKFDNPDAPVARPDDGTEQWMVTDEEFR